MTNCPEVPFPDSFLFVLDASRKKDIHFIFLKNNDKTLEIRRQYLYTS